MAEEEDYDDFYTDYCPVCKFIGYFVLLFLLSVTLTYLFIVLMMNSYFQAAAQNCFAAIAMTSALQLASSVMEKVK